MYRNASTLLIRMSIIFNSQRHLLAYFRNTEAPLSLKNILHGDIQENMTKTSITAVEQYICETQRFSILSLCE